MRNPRITINDAVWNQVRARAAGTNVTVSTIVEEALDHYLANRGATISYGSVSPEFTGSVVSNTGGESQVASTDSVKQTITGYREVKPVPRPDR